MTDILNTNISHSLFFSDLDFDDPKNFNELVLKTYPDAITYDVNKDSSHPYIKDMQTAERFLHGGSKTYEVHRFFLEHISPDLERAGFDGWSLMISYFPEANILNLSFHYSIKNTTTDHIIALRQSGMHREYPFGDGKSTIDKLAKNICTALNIPFKPIEQSFLCEITKFGEYTDIDEIEQKEAARIYGFLSGDEGYKFVPEELLRERLTHKWGSRRFMRIYAFGQGFLFINLLDTPDYNDYLERQTQYGTATYGACNDYFYMRDCPLTVNHGILFSVEFVMMLKSLISDVIAFQSTYSKRDKTMSYYRRIRETRDFRRKIIMVLERVEHTGISEIGNLSATLMESQHIAPIVDQVKYLLELLEADLDLTYSERNNVLMTILTVLGLLLAASQVVLALI